MTALPSALRHWAFQERFAWGSSAAAAASEATLVLANSAWVATCVQPSYVQRVTAAFGAHVEPLTGADPINAWVAAATRGLINTVINGPLPPTLRFVLVNAVYFKAIWSAPFRRTATVRGRFRALGGGEGTPCALMFRFLDSSCAPGTVVADAPGLGSLVALPYGRSGRFRAVFVLPEAPGAAALDALLQPAALNTLLARALPPPGAAAGVTGDVELFLPRFHAEFGTHDLKPALSSLGLGAAFDPWAAPPCFARMSDEQVYVSSVLHKVVVDVNEEGTEAAAVTLTGFTACAIMSRPRPRRLTFDRPFAMLILDAASHAHAGAQPLLLFGGRVVRPSFDASGTHGEYAEPR
jgi:serpin B